MPRYAALLRGVSPMNAKMSELRKAFELEGFTNVVTVISSGNVVFDAERAPVRTLERRAEAAMKGHIGRTFLTIVRPVNGLRQLIAAEPFTSFKVPRNAKRVVTFLRARPSTTIRFPVESRGGALLTLQGGMIFGYYLPGPGDTTFMPFLEKRFGKEITTRTWDTVVRVARR